MFLRTSGLFGFLGLCVLLAGVLTRPTPTAGQESSPPSVTEDSGTAPASQSSDGVKSILDLSIEQLANTPVRRGTDAEPVSTTVSRIEEKVSEAPGSVYVYTRDTIMKRGYRSLGELLQVVPGFTMFHKDLMYVTTVRGLSANDNEKVTLLINGEELNGVNEPNILNGPINLDNVERVEVVVGPSSFFQRANTLAATVNVITKDIEGSEVIVAAGSALPYSGTFMTGRRSAPDDYISFSFTTEKKTGFDAWNADFQPNLAGRNLTGELDEPNFFSVLKRQYGEWTFQGTAYRTASPELNIDSGAMSNNGRYMDQMYGMYMKNEHPISDTLTRVITADAVFKQQARTNEDGPPVFGTGLEQVCTQMAYSAELGYRFTGIDGHLVQTGVQFEYDQNFDTYYTLELIKTKLVDRDTQELGIYIDDEFQVNDRLKLIGGVRQDHNTLVLDDKWYTGIRSAIVLQTTDTWTTKAMFNRAVRMPSALAALNAAWGNDKPNPPSWGKLAPNAHYPEILSTVELQNVFYIEKLRIGANVFHEELEDFISWYEPHTNVGNFRGTGVELTARAPISDRMVLWANTSYVNSELMPFEAYKPTPGPIEQQHIITNQDGRIIGSPEWTANLGFDREINERLTFSPSLRYFTEQAAFDFTDSKFIIVRNIFYFDATLTWKEFLSKNMDLRLSGYNITDNRSQVGGQWVRDTYIPRGATGVASLNWRF